MATVVDNPNNLPNKPGVYIMRNKYDEVIYVGKSKSLKKRVKSYFKDKHEQTKTKLLMEHFNTLEYIITDTEKEALILEANLIKKYMPHYNVRLKDDKRYPYIKITNEKFPRVIITRNINQKTGQYYGPFTDATALKKTTNFLKKIFKIRTCKNMDGPCLNSQIDLCLAPCSQNISQEEYSQLIYKINLFFQGKYKEIVKNLETDMNIAAENQEFEKAGIIRDQIFSIKSVMEKQNVAFNKNINQDVIAGKYGDNLACIVVFNVREGKIIDKDDFVMTGVENYSNERILTEFIKQFYSYHRQIPNELILQYPIDDDEIIKEWLNDMKGSSVKITIPQKGIKYKLIKMVSKNADIIYNQKEQVKNSMIELKKYLKLPKLPHIIEGFDVSNISGTNAVGSMVSFKDAKPNKKRYRRFKLKTPGPDDYGMMNELLTRRYTKVANGEDNKPDLILIDGGKGQLNVAVDVLNSLNLSDIPVIGLAKKFEEIFIPKMDKPIILPKNSQSLFLLQRVRDESHRFGVAYHRKLRDNELKHSQLDDIPGIGYKRKMNLLRHFKNFDNIKNANLEEILEVKGMNKKVALAVYEYFNN